MLFRSLPAVASKPKKTVTVGDNFYKPKKFAVSVGDTVSWAFKGRAIHDVYVKSGPEKFHSKKQGYGYTFSKVFKKPGSYSIYCTLHPSMTMKITVTAPIPAPTTTTTT